MADMEKIQRLKAAKKKVKEHKLKKEGNQKDETPILNVDSMSSSVNSTEANLPENLLSKAEDLPITNYFSQSLQATTVDPVAFFDMLPSTNTNDSIFTTLNEPRQNLTDDITKNASNGLQQLDEHVNVSLPNEVPPTNSFSAPDAEKNEETQRFHAYDMITYDNAESLRQLSSQMTHLVNSAATTYDVTDFTSDLEKRNQELANLLNSERMKSEQLNADLEIFKAKLLKQEEESRAEKDELEKKLHLELNPLREQLQTHMQTVGILVGEKSELTATLSQCQLMLKQKTGENEELSGRLKTSRARAADLEKELNNLRQERMQYDKIDAVQSEKLKEYETLKRQKEETDLDVSELRKKLEVCLSDNLNLAKETQELKARLSLADIKIQQLTGGESVNAVAQIESLAHDKLLLEKQLAECNQSVKSMMHEREQASQQYQQYVQQLNAQSSALAQKLESVTADNETLSKREQDLVRHVSELERHLQNLQNEHVKVAVTNTNGDHLSNIVEAFETTKAEKIKVEETLNEVRSERDDLLKELLEKKNAIEELEGAVERLRVEQPDNAKLLATIESDQVAAARAVTQNQQLKDQLEEMQNAFIKMSNDKMELTEMLESERHQSKELQDKLHAAATNVRKLSEAIEIKDRELTEIRGNASDDDKESLQLKQLEDRLRHYEAQENSYRVLEKELREACAKVDALTAENLQLAAAVRSETLQAGSCDHAVATTSDNRTNGDVTDVCDSEKPLKNVIVQDAMAMSTLNRDLAMKRLEEKFTKMMEDVANLEDEKQCLEHLVLQLQGETDTIAEYVMLYQHQRAVLKQRASEKEEQLRRLAADKEEMRQKLEKLNGLIAKLMSEQTDVSADLLERHRKMENLCVEHAKNEIETVGRETNGVGDNKTETATEIIALLSEIKTSNLVQADENFHPCPWCSGKLITV